MTRLLETTSATTATTGSRLAPVEFPTGPEAVAPPARAQHDGIPELDIRKVAHALRLSTVFRAFDAVVPGASLDLVASYNPRMLLWQLRDHVGGALAVTYLERRPQAWRIRLTRA